MFDVVASRGTSSFFKVGEEVEEVIISDFIVLAVGAGASVGGTVVGTSLVALQKLRFSGT